MRTVYYMFSYLLTFKYHIDGYLLTLQTIFAKFDNMLFAHMFISILLKISSTSTLMLYFITNENE